MAAFYFSSGAYRANASADVAPVAKVDLESLEPAARQIATQVPQALEILDQWRDENPGKSNRFLHIVYWTPRDKPVSPGYEQRLHDIFGDIKEFYRAELERLGFGSDKTIGLDTNEAGKLKVHLVTGQKNYSQYQVSSGPEIRKECLETLRKYGVNAAEETLVIFCNMSVWDPKTRRISQNSPYYASGSNTEGTAWQVDSPILELKQLTNTGDHVFDGQYGKISLGKYNTIFIGGIVHELGHAFGLPHNKARPDEAKEFGVALMGSGNRAYKDEVRGTGKGAFITLAHGLKLASHPMFSGYSDRMHEDPKTKVSNVNLELDDKGFVVTGNVKGSIPPYGVIAYMNPDGGQDYDATTATCIPDENGDFRIPCHALAAGKSAQLDLVFLHANGKASSFHFLPQNSYTYPYSVDKHGNANISLFQKSKAFGPLIEAIKAGDENPITKLPKGSSDELKAHAQRLIDTAHQQRKLSAPASIADTQKQVVLTDCQFEQFTVGYGAPLFDRNLDQEMLLSSGATCYTSGVFAHAKSRAVYNLGGKWSKLTGFCGLLNKSKGSVEFIILADGKQIFKSPVIRTTRTHSIDIDLTGVKTIELIVSDAGDGIRSDWSAWLDMKLTR